MHMADGLLSPEVGVAMWAVTAGATAYGIKKITDSDLSEKKLPVMAHGKFQRRQYDGKQ